MIISVVNHKGGTGKTTTTLNIGSALASLGQKVLLVDFDAQGSLSYSMGISSSQKSISEILLGEATLEETLQEREGLHILPANSSLADVELAIAKADDRFTHLKSILFSLQRFDFVLIDCPPSLSVLTLNALIASNHVLIPMQMDVLALRGLDSMLQTVAKVKALNSSLKVLGILPVMIDTRKNIHQEITDHIKCSYTERMFERGIRSSVRAAEAPSFGKSVVTYAPSSTTAQDYQRIATDILSFKEAYYEQSLHFTNNRTHGTWQQP